MDDEAFAAFYERSARSLWAYLARTSGDPALAEDIMQESYVRFLCLVNPPRIWRMARWPAGGICSGSQPTFFAITGGVRARHRLKTCRRTCLPAPTNRHPPIRR